MESLIWILLIVGLFFLMHKMGLGCCGGHSHGKDHEEHHEKTKGTGKVSEGEESKESSARSCH